MTYDSFFISEISMQMIIKNMVSNVWCVAYGELVWFVIFRWINQRNRNSFPLWSQTGKITAIRRTAVWEVGHLSASWGANWGAPETPRTITALLYWGVWGVPLIGPPLCRETPDSRTANVSFSSVGKKAPKRLKKSLKKTEKKAEKKAWKRLKKGWIKGPKKCL